jgi:photosystem II stability/assembly factor-like uncharacterized protein
MAQRVLVLLGTKKGGFILEADAGRREWRLSGPLCDTWPINHFSFDPASGTLYAAGGSEWYGAAVWRSDDLGRTWSHSSEGLGYGEGGPDVKTVWSVRAAHGKLYAGVEPAGLFVSENGGRTWAHVRGLREHPSRPMWMPGGGGLILHEIVGHPTDPQQLWVAISAVGTFHTADGGASWTPRNAGVRADFLPEKYPELGQCVHGLALAAGSSELLYQQNHCGMYRSPDGGASWQEITRGLPSQFGFPIALHPRDPDTLYLAPLNGDDQGRYMPDARAAVWRSRDRGDTWQRLAEGLPQDNIYFGAYRQALATDPLSPAGVYLGTSGGHLFASPDEGDSWRTIASFLPTIWSVEVAVVED